ncbi:hypothetical protein [Aureivirga sp. CE67]|uniref:hypothetical protein n=1 Tax=Aureivirga sp. CE67 TaxID=1788983 RepID=UPI0018CBE264|nr:hypothetical protein [Aureivirga sp. CE67]
MKYSYYSLITILILSLSSCKFYGPFQGLYSYQEKVEIENPNLIQFPKSAICELENKETPVIYKIHGEELKSCLNNYDKSIIYLWSPNCTSDVCIPLDLAQDYCDQNNIELFVVAEYYDAKKMKENYTIERPIFSIDTKFYKTDLTNKYLRAFFEDVTNQKMKDFEKFYFFEKDELKSSVDYLEKNDYKNIFN